MCRARPAVVSRVTLITTRALIVTLKLKGIAREEEAAVDDDNTTSAGRRQVGEEGLLSFVKSLITFYYLSENFARYS